MRAGDGKDGLADEEAENEHPRKGLFVIEEEEKGICEEEVRKSEDEEHCVAIFVENGW